MNRYTAQRVIAELLAQGFIEIRVMARTGAIPAECGDGDTGVEGRIYMIADICHGFAGALGGSVFTRERRSRQALAWRWGALGQPGRQWVISTLEDLGPDYVQVLKKCTIGT